MGELDAHVGVQVADIRAPQTHRSSAASFDKGRFLSGPPFIGSFLFPPSGTVPIEASILLGAIGV